MKNLLAILDTQLADEKTSLAATSCDIERAANYCQDNFLKGSTDGKLNSTMAYATQSLGTVSFHISRLAAHFLDALELENNILAEMNDRLEKVKMFVNIHEEKVARKAIGSCTTQKVPIVFQHESVRSDPPPKFIRRAIDYSILDDIGHGIRSPDPTFNQYGVPLMHATGTIVRRASASNSGSLHGMFGRQHSTISCRTVGSKTSIEYAAPTVQAGGSLRYASGTVGRTAGIYRTAVVPPQHFFGPMTTGPIPASVSGGTSPASIPSNYASSSSAGIPCVLPAGSEAASTHHSGRSSGSSSVIGASATQQALHQQQQQGGSLRTPIHYAVNENFAQQQQQVSVGQFMLPQQQQPIMVMMGSSGPPISVKMPVTTGDMTINGTAAHTNMLHQQQQQQLHMQHLQLQRHQQNQQFAAAHLGAQQQQYAQQQQQQQQYQRPPTTTTGGVQQTYAVQMPPCAAVENVTTTAGHQLPPMHLPMRVGGNEVNSLPSATGSCELVPRQPGDPAWVPDYYMEKVVTLYEYTRDKDDELTFTENQIIYVIKKNDDGWWEGIMNGVTGLFPGNYVELCDT